MNRVILATILVLGSLGFAQAVLALTISPLKMEFSVDPGDIINSQFILINEERETKTVYSSFQNFEAGDETGSPKFLSEETDLATWIECPSEVTLKPNEQKLIPFRIKIPEDAEPGGHFAAIFWGTIPPKTEGRSTVAIGSKLGILVLLKVSGDITEQGELLEFNTLGQRKFFSHLPVTLYYRFENKGNVQLKPKGDIEIKNIFGKTSAVLEANEAKGNVLPKSIRRFEVKWNPEKIVEGKGFFNELKKEKTGFALGRYSANLDLKWGEKGQSSQAKLSFWIVPWRILSLGILIVLILIFLLVKGVKRYNRWIISKAIAKK